MQRRLRFADLLALGIVNNRPPLKTGSAIADFRAAN